MKHPVSIILIALLVLSLPVSAVGTGSTNRMAIAQDEPTLQSPYVFVSDDHARLDETPNRLVLDGQTKTTYATLSPDFSLVIANQDGAIRTDYRSFAFEAEFENLEDDENRSEAIHAEVEHIEERLDGLREREREVITDYDAGDASEDDILRMLAQNYQEAEQIENALSDLDDHAGRTSDISDPVRNIKAELGVYTSPIRADIDAALRGDEGADRLLPLLSMKTSQSGLTISMITDDGEYLRETTRYDNRDPDGDDQIETMRDARESAEDRYPWAFDTTSGTSISQYGLVQLYQVQISHDQGQLSVYFDGATGEVYHERQALNVNRVPIEATDTIAGENVNVTLDQTHGTAPASVTVTDSEDGEPVDATVIVDETIVGETGVNGKLWFAPPTDGFEFSVQTDSESINATVVSR